VARMAECSYAHNAPGSWEVPGNDDPSPPNVELSVTIQRKSTGKSTFAQRYTQYATRARYCRMANAVTVQPTMVSTITTTQCRSS
jgi:hypothetical protein